MYHISFPQHHRHQQTPSTTYDHNHSSPRPSVRDARKVSQFWGYYSTLFSSFPLPPPVSPRSPSSQSISRLLRHRLGPSNHQPRRFLQQNTGHCIYDLDRLSLASAPLILLYNRRSTHFAAPPSVGSCDVDPWNVRPLHRSRLV